MTPLFVVGTIAAMNESVGERICAKALSDLSLNSKQLATELGISYETLRKWKTGETEPTPANRRAIAALLKVSEVWVVFGDDRPARDIAEPTLEQSMRVLAKALRHGDNYLKQSAALNLHELALSASDQAKVDRLVGVMASLVASGPAVDSGNSAAA